MSEHGLLATGSVNVNPVDEMIFEGRGWQSKRIHEGVCSEQRDKVRTKEQGAMRIVDVSQTDGQSEAGL